jgi:hypothetical protein
MVKYGEFTIIIDKNRGGIFNKLYYNVFGVSNDESYYKYNSDIIYTFYDNPEKSYSEREIYTATNDYENKYFCFLNDSFYPFIHPTKISMITCTIELKIPKFDIKSNSYKINFSEIFKNIPLNENTYNIIISMYNCIYKDNLTEKNIFSIVKYKSSDIFPSFMFYYDDTILNKKEVIYLIKKIIDVDFS